jgi:aspartate aminotransferase
MENLTASATLVADEEVRRRRAAGEPVLPLAFGQAGVPVHPLLRAALAEASDRNAYGPIAGTDELRAAAAGYWSRRGLPTDPDAVLAGPGSKALLYAALSAIGGDVVVPRPSWVSYAAQARLLGVRPLFVPTPPRQGGVPDPDALADAVRRARADGRRVGALVLTLPDNPTGRLAPAATIRAVCEAARELELVIVSDEIYRDLVFDQREPVLSPAEVVPERVIVTSGLSKSLALGGWRIGVARLPSGVDGQGLRDRMVHVASEIWSSPAQPVQHAAAVAFAEPEELTRHVAAARAMYERLSTAVADRFAAAGALVPAPQAAFYVYPDFEPMRDAVHTGAELAALLSRHGVAVLPGSAFGEPESALRLRVCTGMLSGDDDRQRDEAMRATDPTRLSWIAEALETLGAALAAVTG